MDSTDKSPEVELGSQIWARATTSVGNFYPFLGGGQDDQFDTAGLAVGDRFPIDTGFGIVTSGSVRLVPPT